MKPDFTHAFIGGQWWHCSIYFKKDFIELNELGKNEIDGTIYLATDKHGEKHILKNDRHERK